MGAAGSKPQRIGSHASICSNEAMHRESFTVLGTRVCALVAGEGPLVLFIHGTGGSGRAWANQIRRLSQTHKVVAVDLPGYGESELGEAIHATGDYVPFLDAWMGSAGWESAVVVGSSMGGRLALQLALDYPHRVKALVLVNSSGLRLADHPMMSPANVSPETFMKALFHRPSHQFVAARAVSTLPPWYDTMKRLNAAGPNPDLAGRLGEIRVQTLILWGEHDQVIPPPYAEAFHQGIANSQLKWLESCGHVPMLERPGEVNDALMEFLSQL